MYDNTHELRVKVGEGGRMIIPATYRKAMGIHPGDELVMRFQHGELRLFQQTQALKRIRALVKRKSHRDHVSDFLASRKEDSGE